MRTDAQSIETDAKTAKIASKNVKKQGVQVCKPHLMGPKPKWPGILDNRDTLATKGMTLRQPVLLPTQVRSVLEGPVAVGDEEGCCRAVWIRT